MWRIQTVLAVLFASMLVGFSQMQFYAVHSSAPGPQGTVTIGAPVELGTGAVSTATIRMNLMFISIPGSTNQPIRSVLFEFTPATPIPWQNGVIEFISADPGQASNQLTMTVPVPMAAPRSALARFPARLSIRDNNNNVQEQQVTLEVFVEDTEPFAFQRPNPNAPRDRLEIRVIVNNLPVTLYSGSLVEPRGEVNLFVGGRII